jgi:predicted DNA-binding transcriptional regulator AlpA
MEDKLPNPFDILNERLTRIENLLSNILVENQNDSAGQRTTIKTKTIDLAVAITGLKKKTIYNLVYKRLIPHSKRGKRLYFDEGELTAWISKGKRKTLEELGLKN